MTSLKFPPPPFLAAALIVSEPKSDFQESFLEDSTCLLSREYLLLLFRLVTVHPFNPSGQDPYNRALAGDDSSKVPDPELKTADEEPTANGEGARVRLGARYGYCVL